MSDNRFYFPFFVVSDDLGCRVCVVRPVDVVLTIGCQQVGVEYRVDLPLGGKLKPVRQGTKDFGDYKWPLSLHGKLLVIRDESEVLCFQPDLLSFLERCESLGDALSHLLPCQFVCCHSLEANLLEVAESLFYGW